MKRFREEESKRQRNFSLFFVYFEIRKKEKKNQEIEAITVKG